MEKHMTNETVAPPEAKKPGTVRLYWRGEGEAPTLSVIGTVRIDLPSTEEQRAGFDCPLGGLLRNQVDGYKVDAELVRAAPAKPKSEG